jgi:DNA-binding response OmpR family regulator
MKILIAEDDLTSRLILTAILKKWGFDPVAAEDGSAAWDILQKPDAPRLILLDWNMPGLDGLEICRRLRENESRNPPYVILLTARGEKGDIVQGLEAGANDYVSKPEWVSGCWSCRLISWKPETRWCIRRPTTP